jgi:hypothetical protein
MSNLCRVASQLSCVTIYNKQPPPQRLIFGFDVPHICCVFWGVVDGVFCYCVTLICGTCWSNGPMYLGHNCWWVQFWLKNNFQHPCGLIHPEARMVPHGFRVRHQRWEL